MDIDKKDYLPYLLAYGGAYFAFDGVSKENANSWSNSGKMVPLEEEVILNGINRLLDLTNEDINEDGIVNMDDARQLVDAAILDYNRDTTKKVGDDSTVAIQNLSLLLEKVARVRQDSPLVLDFCYNFLKDVSNASNRSDRSQSEKLLKIVHGAWYKD